MTAPYLGNPKRTIEVLQKYDFVFRKIRAEFPD